MKYFLYGDTYDKPVLRFYKHWYEVTDFLKMMNWKIGKNPDANVEVFRKMDEEELEKKNKS